MLTIQNSWTTDAFPALKISISGIRDMNHWLRVLVVVPEDAGSVPSTYVRQVSTACNSNHTLLTSDSITFICIANPCASMHY